MFPDKSILIGQKLVKNAKIEKFKCDILSDFQTLWQQQILIKHRGNTCCSVKVLHLLVDGSSILSWSNMTHTPRAFIKIKTSKLFSHKHSAWKLPKKSHSTLRVKRAKFIFWVDNWRVFENPKLAGKQCLQTGHFWWKMTKLQNPNATFRRENSNANKNLWFSDFF